MTKLALLASLLFACGGGSSAKPSTSTPATAASTEAAPSPAKADGTLFERLGGRPAITAVVHEFLGRVAADARIKHRFFNTNIERLEMLLVEQVCMATGGPCRYSGQDMETSHAGMEVVEEEFTALVEDLAGALDKFEVPAREKGELLGALGPLAPAIVTPKDRLKPVGDALLAKALAVSVKLKDPLAIEIMEAAILAAKRGQRNYADQLFSRVEAIAGVAAVAGAAPTFREGAPPRITTPLKKVKDTAPQPRLAGNSDEDEPGGAGPASLSGSLTIDGKPLDGLGTVMLFPQSGGGKKRKPKLRTVEQRDKQFSPRVLAVPPGSTVSFPNFDGVYHNVFSISPTKKFDVGLYKDGDSRDLKFEKPGIVRLGCNIHAKMASFIVVVDAPHYVVVEGAKPFTFKTLKPGKYKVRAWSERSAAPTETEITIKAGTNTATFDVRGDAEPGPSEDKFGMTRR